MGAKQLLKGLKAKITQAYGAECFVDRVSLERML